MGATPTLWKSGRNFSKIEAVEGVERGPVVANAETSATAEPQTRRLTTESIDEPSITMAAGPSMTAAEHVAKTLFDEHADMFREAVTAVVAQLMEAEISAEIGAAYGVVSPDRLTHRNGYRPRPWETRVGEIELLIPRTRSGEAYFPSFLEPRRRSEQAIVALVMEASVNGVSTRTVDRLVEQLGIHGMTTDRVSALCRALESLRLGRLEEEARPGTRADVLVGAHDERSQLIQEATLSVREIADHPVEGDLDDRVAPRRDRHRQLVLDAQRTVEGLIQLEAVERPAADEVRDPQGSSVAGAGVASAERVLPGQAREKRRVAGVDRAGGMHDDPGAPTGRQGLVVADDVAGDRTSQGVEDRRGKERSIVDALHGASKRDDAVDAESPDAGHGASRPSTQVESCWQQVTPSNRRGHYPKGSTRAASFTLITCGPQCQEAAAARAPIISSIASSSVTPCVMASACQTRKSAAKPHAARMRTCRVPPLCQAEARTSASRSR